MNIEKKAGRKQKEHKQALILCIVIVVVIGIVWSLPSSMRDQAQELQCKLRLKRLGDAVNYWVYDNNFKGFPPIKNATAYTLWQPKRMSSTSAVLRQYLGGDIPRSQHQGESRDDYISRLRKKEWSVCPSTGFAYWYESLILDESDVRTSSQEPENHRQEFKYFSCQHHQGLGPHTVDDQNGIFASYGKIIHRLISQDDIDTLQEKLQKLENKNAGKTMGAWSHNLLYLRKRVGSFQQQIKEHPEGFPAITLFTEVRFTADK